MEDTLTVCGKEYRKLKLLGKGKGGYSYLVSGGDSLCVLKQIHHEPCAYYQFGDKMEAEMRDYSRLRGIGITMPRMLAADRDRERILKEYIEGETVYELVERDALPGECLRQVKAMCALLYAANTNIDYFPTNFIFREGTLYYIDYECNDYMEEWDFDHWGAKYWARTPEFLKYAQENK